MHHPVKRGEHGYDRHLFFAVVKSLGFLRRTQGLLVFEEHLGRWRGILFFLLFMSLKSDRERSFQWTNLLEDVASCLAGRLGNHVLHEEVQIILEVGYYFDLELS